MCIFCQIVAGKSPSYKVWEDSKHLAFLSIFPNTKGVTVLVTKEHYSSNFTKLPTKVREDLIAASAKVSDLLVKAFPSAGRCALVFEGFGVNHIHAKLFPLHGTNDEKWKPISSGRKDFVTNYEGCVSTHDGNLMDSATLQKWVEQIKSVG
ncbi:MAG: HIT family protein [Bdellovibrionaceae bacterium]|nr:HIT family protein [Pseudobdellovibrionaceae bacterium]